MSIILRGLNWFDLVFQPRQNGGGYHSNCYCHLWGSHFLIDKHSKAIEKQHISELSKGFHLSSYCEIIFPQKSCPHCGKFAKRKNALIFNELKTLSTIVENFKFFQPKTPSTFVSDFRPFPRWYSQLTHK